jgi:transposase-like protein
MGIFTKNKNPGAYRGRLTCPVCRSEAIRFVENVTPYRLRYRCRKCGLPFQYDISNRLNHPYAALKKAKWQKIVESSAYRENRIGGTKNG